MPGSPSWSVTTPSTTDSTMTRALCHIREWMTFVRGRMIMHSSVLRPSFPDRKRQAAKLPSCRNGMHDYRVWHMMDYWWRITNYEKCCHIFVRSFALHLPSRTIPLYWWCPFMTLRKSVHSSMSLRRRSRRSRKSLSRPLPCMSRLWPLPGIHRAQLSYYMSHRAWILPSKRTRWGFFTFFLPPPHPSWRHVRPMKKMHRIWSDFCEQEHIKRTCGDKLAWRKPE